MDTQETTPRPTVLLVDDTPDNLTTIGELLAPHVNVRLANNGERALQIAQSDSPPDLILLDIMMPGIDGFEVCRKLKAYGPTRTIPVIFLTALADTADVQMGFDLGAVDYVTKPVIPPILLARVKAHLALHATAEFLRNKSVRLENQMERRMREVATLRDVVNEMETMLGKSA